MDTNLFAEGLNLLVLGMGFVFTFLVFLVFAMKAMSGMLGRYQPVPATSPASAGSRKKAQPKANDEQLVAVLAAAVHHKKMTS
ncbi:OadG family protein [Vibrio quintilis]|uniref:Probable oxaloacetate decarboxylase gamma chain n=1 Tax=Vibrio quintilis TaxID=1117707 RepID=A0A1M7YRD5_9VIBR|nr:OadG family protein [Vibrio quintilis]SHO55184.1 oxaloacetate decarboxylase subunit gamma [Vibrio quintilis]